MKFDPTMIELAREAGLGRHPKQYQMGGTLGIGRGVGRWLHEGNGQIIDRDPGIELRHPAFRGYYRNALTQYRDFLAQQKMPVAVEIVDEPREVPNPWNRNLADTIAYGNLVREAGLIGFVTPMGDTNSGKDYTALADHADITSVHAWKASAGLMARTRKNGKTLWLYNTGMDRFSWGFYNWAIGSEGRWEWHFCWSEDEAKGGYPGREWFNPFTSMHGFAPYAPIAYPGGMLFSSRFLNVAEGINDARYLHTLERLLAKGGQPALIAEARQLLAEIRRSIPEFPASKGLEDGALVGQGLDDDARFQVANWRNRIATLLKKSVVSPD